MTLRKDQKALLLASVAAAVLWGVPLLRLLVLPLVLYNTHIHELCHALAALATGGSVDKILVFANGSGVALISGGWMPVVASAGYIGSAVVGGLILAWAKDEHGAKGSLWGAAVFMAFSLVAFVRGDAVGLVSAVAWLVALMIAATRLRGLASMVAAQFLGVSLCLTGIQSFVALFYVAARVDGHSDAKIMEQATGIPDVAWASLWLIVSLVTVWAGLRTAWRAPSRSR